VAYSHHFKTVFKPAARYSCLMVEDIPRAIIVWMGAIDQRLLTTNLFHCQTWPQSQFLAEQCDISMITESA
jgi:hypothetical protein